MPRSTLWRTLHDDLQARRVSSKKAFTSTQSWKTRLCHIAWRALARTHRAGGGKKTTLHHTPATQQHFFEGAPNPALHVASCSPDVRPLDFHWWEAWEVALGDRCCAPEAAISSTAFDDWLTCIRFFFFRLRGKYSPAKRVQVKVRVARAKVM